MSEAVLEAGQVWVPKPGHRKRAKPRRVLGFRRDDVYGAPSVEWEYHPPDGQPGVMLETGFRRWIKTHRAVLSDRLA